MGSLTRGSAHASTPSPRRPPRVGLARARPRSGAPCRGTGRGAGAASIGFICGAICRHAVLAPYGPDRAVRATSSKPPPLLADGHASHSPIGSAPTRSAGDAPPRVIYGARVSLFVGLSVATMAVG